MLTGQLSCLPYKDVETVDCTTILPLIVICGDSADWTTILPLIEIRGDSADWTTILPLIEICGDSADWTTILPLIVLVICGDIVLTGQLSCLL